MPWGRSRALLPLPLLLLLQGWARRAVPQRGLQRASLQWGALLLRRRQHQHRHQRQRYLVLVAVRRMKTYSRGQVERLRSPAVPWQPRVPLVAPNLHQTYSPQSQLREVQRAAHQIDLHLHLHLLLLLLWAVRLLLQPPRTAPTLQTLTLLTAVGLAAPRSSATSSTSSSWAALLQTYFLLLSLQLLLLLLRAALLLSAGQRSAQHHQT